MKNSSRTNNIRVTDVCGVDWVASRRLNLQSGSFPGSKSDMALTLTLSQSGALYLAHHRTPQRRSALFRRFTAPARIQPPDIRRRTFADAHVSRRFHPGNGR